MSFIDIADNSEIEEPVHRNYKNARTAHDEVVSLLKIIQPQGQERQAIEVKLAILKKRLDAVGE